MKGYFFHEELFKSLHVALEMHISDITRAVGVPLNTWRGWKRGKDVPMAALIQTCNALCIPIGHFICANEVKSVMLGSRHYMQSKEEFHTIRLLNNEFGEEVTTMQGRQVLDFCDLTGVSATTFYKNFRNVETIGRNIGISTWLNMCNKTKTYPMDFMLSDGVEVPLLKGYSRRQYATAETLAKRNIDLLAYNAKLIQQLANEHKKVEELKVEVKRLRSMLRYNGVDAGEGGRMIAAESEQGKGNE